MKNILAISVISAILAGCSMQQLNDFATDNKRALIGGGAAALAGTAVGYQLGGKQGALIGAGLGALAGGAIGHYMDNQQHQLQQQMQGTGIGVTRVNRETLKLNIPSALLFAVNQSDVAPRLYPVLNRIAQTLNQYPKTIVHVYGFTDGSGNPEYNLKLSKARASHVAEYLAAQGVNQGRLVIKGYGEQFATSQNNPQERRVEIYIKAINQDAPQSAYQSVY